MNNKSKVYLEKHIEITYANNINNKILVEFIRNTIENINLNFSNYDNIKLNLLPTYFIAENDILNKNKQIDKFSTISKVKVSDSLFTLFINLTLEEKEEIIKTFIIEGTIKKNNINFEKITKYLELLGYNINYNNLNEQKKTNISITIKPNKKKIKKLCITTMLNK